MESSSFEGPKKKEEEGRRLKLLKELLRKRGRPRKNLAERTINDLRLRDLTIEETWLEAADRNDGGERAKEDSIGRGPRSCKCSLRTYIFLMNESRNHFIQLTYSPNPNQLFFCTKLHHTNGQFRFCSTVIHKNKPHFIQVTTNTEKTRQYNYGFDSFSANSKRPVKTSVLTRRQPATCAKTLPQIQRSQIQHRMVKFEQ